MRNLNWYCVVVVSVIAFSLTLVGCRNQSPQVSEPREVQAGAVTATGCNQHAAYTLRLTFRGILDLVSKEGSASAWVFIPNLMDPQNDLPANLPVMSAHEARLILSDGVSGGSASTSRCHELGSPCTVFSLDGAQLEIDATPQWPAGLIQDRENLNGDRPTIDDAESLKWLADMDYFAKETYSGDAVRWSDFTAPTYGGKHLTARIPLSEGRLFSSAFWRETNGDIKLLEYGQRSGSSLPKMAFAEAFTLELSVVGCSVLRLTKLSDGKLIREIELSAPNGGVLQAVVDHEMRPPHSSVPYTDHFLGHYWLRKHPDDYSDPWTLLDPSTGPMDNGVCSPGSSQGP